MPGEGGGPLLPPPPEGGGQRLPPGPLPPPLKKNPAPYGEEAPHDGNAIRGCHKVLKALAA